MPFKYRRRSQRNRRREGNARYTGAPYNGPAAPTLTVSGAGDGAGVNGVYTQNSPGLWDHASGATLTITVLR